MDGDRLWFSQMTWIEIPSLVMMISVIWYLYHCLIYHHHEMEFLFAPFGFEQFHIR